MTPQPAHKFGARHRAAQALLLLWHAIAAEARDDSDAWQRARFGKLDRDYAKFCGETLLRLIRKPPHKARSETKQFAMRLELGRGRYSWYGKHKDFAGQLATSVRELAEGIPRKPRGNPNFVRSKTKSRAQARVNAAHDELCDLAQSVGYEDWWAETQRPGRAGKPSRGRNLVVQIALRNAREADDLYDPAECVRERLKSDRRAARRQAARSDKDRYFRIVDE